MNFLVSLRQHLIGVPEAESLKPSLQVPRMPNASQPADARACNPALRNTTSTWSARGASGERRAVVTMPSAARAVGDHRRLPLERDARVAVRARSAPRCCAHRRRPGLRLSRRRAAIARRTAGAAAADARAAPAMPHHAGDLGLVHRIDHRGRRAGPAERITDIDDVGDARAFAAELARHRDAEQPLRAQSAQRLAGEPRLRVDRNRMRSGDRRGPLHPDRQIAGRGRAQMGARIARSAAGGTRRISSVSISDSAAIRTLTGVFTVGCRLSRWMPRKRSAVAHSYTELEIPGGIRQKLVRFFGVKVTGRR